MAKRVKPGRSRITVYDRLRADVISEVFGPGERLMINELAARYDVSITPVREALARLSVEKLVTFVPSQGFFCRTPDLKELRDLYHLLEVLLIFATRQAATRSLPLTAAHLGLPKEAPAPSGSPGAARARRMEAVIQAFLELAENEEIAAIGENVLARTHKIRQVGCEAADYLDAFSVVVDAICEAVRRRDHVAAETIIKREMQQKLERLPELLKDWVSSPYLARSTPKSG